HRPEDRDQAAQMYGALGSEGRARGTIPLVRADGTLLHVEYSAAADILPGVHLSVLRDVTARRQREEMSERYALLSRHARDIVLFIDRDGVIVEANDAAVAAYGYARDDLLGLNIRQLRAEETRDLVGPQMEEAFER